MPYSRESKLTIEGRWVRIEDFKVVRAPVVIDQARARRAGITSEEVANSLQANVDGIQATEYREGDQAIPVMIQSVEEERAARSDFYNIRVYSAAKGADVALMQIANFSGEFALSRVARHNQERALTVEFKHEILKAPELLEGPAGQRVDGIAGSVQLP